MRTVFFLLCLSANYIFASDFRVSLDLQWDYCSDQLTLICTHSNADTDPLWIYNGTAAGGVALDNIPGAGYTEATSTRHVAVIRGIENVMAVDSFTFQCVYNLLNSVRVKSNKEQYYWGYAKENSFVDYGNSFSYYNCTVDVSMAPQCRNHANISVSSSPPTANQSILTPNGLNYNISDLQRCQRYTVEVTAQVGAHKYTNQTQDTVMLHCNATQTNITGKNNPLPLYIAVGTVVPGVLLIVAIVTTVAIGVCCKKCILTKGGVQESQVEHKHCVLQRGERAVAMTDGVGDNISNLEEDSQGDDHNYPVHNVVTTSQEK